MICFQEYKSLWGCFKDQSLILFKTSPLGRSFDKRPPTPLQPHQIYLLYPVPSFAVISKYSIEFLRMFFYFSGFSKYESINTMNSKILQFILIRPNIFIFIVRRICLAVTVGRLVNKKGHCKSWINYYFVASKPQFFWDLSLFWSHQYLGTLRTSGSKSSLRPTVTRRWSSIWFNGWFNWSMVNEPGCLSRQNISDFVWVWTCDAMNAVRSLNHCST